MKGYVDVSIPVKKYIKAYIVSQIGNEPKLRLGLHPILNKLYDLLQHKQNHQQTKITCNYSDQLRIYIPLETFKRRGHHLNHSNVRAFNRDIERKIKHRFYELMDDKIEILPSFEAHLQEVRKKLGIDIEAWSDDSMKKNYYRYRLASGKPLLYKSFGVNVPSDKAADISF